MSKAAPSQVLKHRDEALIPTQPLVKGKDPMNEPTHDKDENITPAEGTAREALIWADGYAAALRHAVEELQARSARAGQRVADLTEALR